MVKIWWKENNRKKCHLLIICFRESQHCHKLHFFILKNALCLHFYPSSVDVKRFRRQGSRHFLDYGDIRDTGPYMVSPLSNAFHMNSPRVLVRGRIARAMTACMFIPACVNRAGFTQYSKWSFHFPPMRLKNVYWENHDCWLCQQANEDGFNKKHPEKI